jgi:hypothetical protein
MPLSHYLELFGSVDDAAPAAPGIAPGIQPSSEPSIGPGVEEE